MPVTACPAPAVTAVTGLGAVHSGTALPERRATVWLPLVLGALGALAVLGGGLSWLTGTLAGALTLCGLALSLYQRHRLRAFMATIDEFLAQQHRFAQQVAPIWAGHISPP